MSSKLDFGAALQLIKSGGRVAREGWNGKGMFVYMTKGSHDSGPATMPPLIDGISASLFEYGDNGTVTRLPCISMATATGATLNGWLASQADMLAEDWCVVAGVAA